MDAADPKSGAVGGGRANGAVRNQVTQDRDTVDLARTGKKQVLKHYDNLGGYACVRSVRASQNGLVIRIWLINQPFQRLFSWVRKVSVAQSPCSMHLNEMPRSDIAIHTVVGQPVWFINISLHGLAGGQYHWVSVLAPPRTQKLLSYITGWTTVISWMAAATAVSFFCATLLQAIVALDNPTYEGTRWQATLMMWSVLLLAVLVTTVLGRVLPFLEVLLLVLHILGFFGTMIPLVYNAHGGSDRSREVFTRFFNDGGWPTQTLAFFIGLKGTDGAVHVSLTIVLCKLTRFGILKTNETVQMAEEVEKSSVNVARAMIYSILINGSLGFAMLLSILYSVDSIEDLVQSKATYPIIDILASSFNSKGGATAIIGLIIFMNFAATIGALSSSGRMMWAFARDRGLPGWQWLKRVDGNSSIPVNTILITATAAVLLGLVNLGSTTAFQIFLSVVLDGFYGSYLAATSLLLYRRLRGDIDEFHVDPCIDQPTGKSSGVSHDKRYVWGPWRVKGWLGTLNNIFAVVYLLITLFFALWPAAAKVDAQTMNYSCLILGTVMLGSIVWYFVRARKYYTGPVLEVQLLERALQVHLPMLPTTDVKFAAVMTSCAQLSGSSRNVEYASPKAIGDHASNLLRLNVRDTHSRSRVFGEE
nr:choline transport protein [Quercus suber]